MMFCIHKLSWFALQNYINTRRYILNYLMRIYLNFKYIMVFYKHIINSYKPIMVVSMIYKAHRYYLH